MASGKEKEKAATAAHWDVALVEYKAHPPQHRRTDLPLLRSLRPKSHRVVYAREMVAGAPTAVGCSLTGQPAVPQVSPLATNESHVQGRKWG